MQCATGATCGMMLRQMYDDVGLPWRKRATGSPRAPASRYAMVESNTERCGSVEGMLIVMVS